jgi:hypothetical protein
LQANDRKSKIKLRGRNALLWSLIGFAVLQLSLGVCMDRWQPELRDPEYGYKLMRLRERLHEEPNRPLMLVIGSSRAGLGFNPGEVAVTLPQSAETPAIFNFAMTGSGPFMELMFLKRLLAAGIHPQWLVIEILPALLHQDEPWGEPLWLDTTRLGCADLPLFWQNTADPLTRYACWLHARLVPWSSYRFGVLSRYAPQWLPFGARQDGWKGMDRAGWIAFPASSVTAQQYRKSRDFALHQYGPAFYRFHISSRPDRNLRQLLDLCHQEGIRPVLMVMPEGSEFQGWYTPKARREITRYLGGLSRQYDIPLIDARCWLPDCAFCDSHHLLPDGAKAFSRRFGEEILRPLVLGEIIVENRYWK